jgi:cytosine/uracil/thiamine/allantoin permease
MQWRGGRYWYSGGVLWTGVAAFVLGLAASVACSNSDLYHSPLMTQFLGGTDLSFEAGMLVAGVIYYVMSKGRIAAAFDH